MAGIDVLLTGFFGTSDRGFLGWSGLYLVTTPSGRRIMFDTAGDNERGTIPKLLKERRLTPADIDCVVISHLHFDHAANWDLFVNAEIVVHESEVAYAQASDDIALLRYPVPALLAHKRLRLITGDRGQLKFRRGQLEFPSHRRAEAIQVGDDLYGERSAGEAAVAADTEVVAGNCGSEGGNGLENGVEISAGAPTAERDATKAYVANAARSVCG